MQDMQKLLEYEIVCSKKIHKFEFTHILIGCIFFTFIFKKTLLIIKSFILK